MEWRNGGVAGGAIRSLSTRRLQGQVLVLIACVGMHTQLAAGPAPLQKLRREIDARWSCSLNDGVLHCESFRRPHLLIEGRTLPSSDDSHSPGSSLRLPSFELGSGWRLKLSELSPYLLAGSFRRSPEPGLFMRAGVLWRRRGWSVDLSVSQRLEIDGSQSRAALFSLSGPTSL